MSTAPLEFRDPHLRGVWAPLVIPWQRDGSDGQVDAGALRELVARYVAAGVHGVYATGTDGEFHVLGTFIGVLIIAIGFNGLAIFGAPTWTQFVFQGAILILAVGLSSLGRVLSEE